MLHEAGMNQLGHVAGLLAAVGQACPATTDPGVALLCLAAAEDLRRLGVLVPRTAVDPVQVADAVNAALAILATLPDELFAITPVLDAAANARAARAVLTSLG